MTTQSAPFTEEEKRLLKSLGFLNTVTPEDIDALLANSTSARCAGMSRTEFLQDLDKTCDRVGPTLGIRTARTP